MYQVISIGSATLDIFVKSHDFKLLKNEASPTGVVLCETYGAKLEVEEIEMLSGGGATNSAVSFQTKGLRAGLISEMGTDAPSEVVLKELQKYGVGTELIVQEESERTGISVILVAGEGGRSIVTARGASKMLELRDIPWDNLDTEWFYITSLGGKIDVLESLVGHGKEHGIKVALNPGSGELANPEIIKGLCNNLEVLLLNKEEAERLVGENDNNQELIRQVANLGARYTVMTMGGKGAYFATDNKCLFVEPSPTLPIETTGAGDAFGSGLVSGLIMGWDEVRSLQLAASNAEGVISKIGSKAGLINLQMFEYSEKALIKEV